MADGIKGNRQLANGFKKYRPWICTGIILVKVKGSREMVCRTQMIFGKSPDLVNPIEVKETVKLSFRYFRLSLVGTYRRMTMLLLE